MAKPPADVVGFRGERLVELRLTDHRGVGETLFHPAFLGDKWPAIDFYVELLSVAGSRPFFFGQAKATSADLAAGATSFACFRFLGRRTCSPFTSQPSACSCDPCTAGCPHVRSPVSP